MSNNLANLMVGFGLDLSALQKDAPEAFRILNQQTLGMSAEMKRASREGAESFRLIDEALGIHVSRPLTRILTQEFPSLATALQSLLGVGIAGALVSVGFEAFDKIAKSVERARKAEEEFQESTRKVGEVFSDAMQSFEKADKLRSLSGLDKKLFEIDYTSIEEGRKKIDELAEAMQKESKAAADASSWTTKFLAAIGEAAHVTFSSQGELGVEAIDKQLVTIRQRFDELSKLDALNRTKESAKYLAEQVTSAKNALDAMKESNRVGQQVTGGDFEQGFTFSQIYSQPEIDRQKQFLDNLGQIQQVLGASGKDRSGAENEARQADAIEQSRKAIADLQGDLKRWNEASDAGWKSWMHTNDELEKALGKIREMGTLSESLQWEQRSKALNFPSIGTVAPPPGAPQLKDQGELEKLQGDQNASWQKAGDVLNQIETPLQKYQTGLAVLKELLDQGRLSTDQFKAAEQQLAEQTGKNVDELQKKLETFLKHSQSAADGARAFFTQLEIDSSQNGKMAFELLNSGLKGFEDELTKAVFEGKAKWKDLFRSMSEEAFKFTLQKDIAGLFHAISGTGIGKSLSGLFPQQGTSAGSGASLAAAAGTLQSGSTTLMAAATTLQAAALSLQAHGAEGDISGAAGEGDISGAAGGGFDESFVSSDAPGFASGTDSAPGGLAWVGEQGPELMNLPGGTSVTPSSSLRSGGDTHYYDMRGSVVTDDLLRKADFARAMRAARPGIIGEAVANFSEIQKRTAGSR
jgi:hypothetical protein